MGEMLEDGAVFGEERVQHGLAVALGAAPQDVMMGAGDDLDGIELHESEAVDQGEWRDLRARLRGGEAMSI